jgi:hypothetical protein
VRGTFASLELRSPSNAVIFGGFIPEDAADLGDFGPFVLSETGPYTLTVGNEFFADVFSYRFVLGGLTTSSTGEISIGATHAGALEVAGDADEWTFEGTVGDRVFLDMMCSDCAFDRVLEITALAPDGSTLFSVAADGVFVLGDKGPVALTQNGTYRLVFRSSTAGLSYAFVLHAPEVDLAAVTPGVPTAGSLDVPGDIDEWSFTATAGAQFFLDELSFSATGPPLGPFQFDLFAPSGAVVFETTRLAGTPVEADRGPDTLPETGTYRLQVRAFPDYDATLSYSFRIDL